jgi:DNA-binding helix-hairpin-helix protein with protein kinase domain
MLGLKGGAVAIPRWIIIIRALQLIFAILILALTAYALSINRGNDVNRSVPPRHPTLH